MNEKNRWKLYEHDKRNSTQFWIKFWTSLGSVRDRIWIVLYLQVVEKIPAPKSAKIEVKKGKTGPVQSYMTSSYENCFCWDVAICTVSLWQARRCSMKLRCRRGRLASSSKNHLWEIVTFFVVIKTASRKREINNRLLKGHVLMLISYVTIGCKEDFTYRLLDFSSKILAKVILVYFRQAIAFTSLVLDYPFRRSGLIGEQALLLPRSGFLYYTKDITVDKWLNRSKRRVFGVGRTRSPSWPILPTARLYGNRCQHSNDTSVDYRCLPRRHFYGFLFKFNYCK